MKYIIFSCVLQNIFFSRGKVGLSSDKLRLMYMLQIVYSLELYLLFFSVD